MFSGTHGLRSAFALTIAAHRTQPFVRRLLSLCGKSAARSKGNWRALSYLVSPFGLSFEVDFMESAQVDELRGGKAFILCIYVLEGYVRSARKCGYD